MPSPFLERVRADIRLRGYSIRTEKTYLTWIKKYIYFIDKRHPRDVGAAVVKAFLTWLAVERHVAVNTQKVALNALVFLYHKVLRIELGELGFRLATQQRRLPVVLNHNEVGELLNHLTGLHKLAVSLMYGSVLRVSECLRLRIQDIDLDRGALTVRNGKGHKDRQTILSPRLNESLAGAIERGIEIQERDNKQGLGCSLPGALARKYPNAHLTHAWAFIFPSVSICQHPISGIQCRHHLHQTVIRKALRKAVLASEISTKRVTCHTFRHSFATHMLSSGARTSSTPI